MRLLLELLVFAAMIALAWDRTFRERASDIPLVGPKIFAATPTPTPAVAANPPRPIRPTVRPALPVNATPPLTAVPPPRPLQTAAPNGAWMWDQNHRGTLDRPSPGSRSRP